MRAAVDTKSILAAQNWVSQLHKSVYKCSFCVEMRQRKPPSDICTAPSMPYMIGIMAKFTTVTFYVKIGYRYPSISIRPTASATIGKLYFHNLHNNYVYLSH